jgi:hypothetical protein
MQRKSKTNGPSVGSSLGKWAPTCPKSSVWDLGWGAVPTTNPFLKIYVPIQVLMQGQKPKPNWNSFLHILHVRQIQEPECMKTRQPRLHILHAPLNVNQAGVQKHVRQFAFLNLQHFICDLYLLCIAFFCICIFCAFMKRNYFFCTFFLQLFFVCFLRSIFFCIACCIFSRFKISKVNPQGADTSVAAVIWCWEHLFWCRTLDVMLAGLITSGYGAALSALVIFQFFISRATGPSLKIIFLNKQHVKF